jgi:hypothetical protein
MPNGVLVNVLSPVADVKHEKGMAREPLPPLEAAQPVFNWREVALRHDGFADPRAVNLQSICALISVGAALMHVPLLNLVLPFCPQLYSELSKPMGPFVRAVILRLVAMDLGLDVKLYMDAEEFFTRLLSDVSCVHNIEHATVFAEHGITRELIDYAPHLLLEKFVKGEHPQVPVPVPVRAFEHRGYHYVIRSMLFLCGEGGAAHWTCGVPYVDDEAGAGYDTFRLFDTNIEPVDWCLGDFFLREDLRCVVGVYERVDVAVVAARALGWSGEERRKALVELGILRPVSRVRTYLGSQYEVIRDTNQLRDTLKTRSDNKQNIQRDSGSADGSRARPLVTAPPSTTGTGDHRTALPTYTGVPGVGPRGLTFKSEKVSARPAPSGKPASSGGFRDGGKALEFLKQMCKRPCPGVKHTVPFNGLPHNFCPSLIKAFGVALTTPEGDRVPCVPMKSFYTDLQVFGPVSKGEISERHLSLIDKSASALEQRYLSWGDKDDVPRDTLRGDAGKMVQWVRDVGDLEVRMVDGVPTQGSFNVSAECIAVVMVVPSLVRLLAICA